MASTHHHLSTPPTTSSTILTLLLSRQYCQSPQRPVYYQQQSRSLSCPAGHRLCFGALRLLCTFLARISLYGMKKQTHLLALLAGAQSRQARGATHATSLRCSACSPANVLSCRAYRRRASAPGDLPVIRVCCGCGKRLFCGAQACPGPITCDLLFCRPAQHCGHRHCLCPPCHLHHRRYAALAAAYTRFRGSGGGW